MIKDKRFEEEAGGGGKGGCYYHPPKINDLGRLLLPAGGKLKRYFFLSWGGGRSERGYCRK